MRPQRKTFSWFRVAVLLWASLWMLAAPLFHVHPEADHRHGEVGHVHGGTVHTVWSPDLDCEFDNYRGIDRTETLSQDAIANLSQFSHVGDGHSEFTFALLSDSSDRRLIHPLLNQALAVTHTIISDPGPRSRLEEQPACGSFSFRLLHDLAARAPPSFLV
jgi:hypothetical protein